MIARPCVPLLVVLGSLGLAGDLPARAEAASPQDRRSSPPGSRIDRLEEWLSAVERHEPGSADDPARQVRSWPSASLDQVAVDLSALVNLMADPDFDLYWTWTRQGVRRAQRTPYSVVDVARLQGLARAAAARGDGNRLLTRGAMLHTDAAAYATANDPPRPGTAGPRSDRVVVLFTDGRQLSVEDASGHWDLARTLLDAVTPDPARDPRVHLWYLATASLLQRHEQLDGRHIARGLELFPDATDLLFLGGTLHERFASPQIQGLARSTRLPGGMTLGIESARSELRVAETLFAQTLAIDPGHVEARLRHGRVLGLLDRHAEARAELVRALPDLVDPRLRYLAELFLGAEADALNDRDEATAAYRRAAGLYPRAQSPRLALSLTAMRGGDTASALAAARPLHDLPVEPIEREDPWWAYHTVQTRDTELWLNRLYAALQAAERR